MQALLQVASCQSLVVRGCNILANSAVKLHKMLLLHPFFPAATQKGMATPTAVPRLTYAVVR
jgi:hypothetical protein